MNFLIKFDILSANQFGFRKNKSTIDAVTKLIEAVVEGLEDRESILSVFLDLSKAFDRVHHKILIRMLEASGIRGLPLEWLKSYLSDRGQCVEIENVRVPKTPNRSRDPSGNFTWPYTFLNICK